MAAGTPPESNARFDAMLRARDAQVDFGTSKNPGGAAESAPAFSSRRTMRCRRTTGCWYSAAAREATAAMLLFSIGSACSSSRRQPSRRAPDVNKIARVLGALAAALRISHNPDVDVPCLHGAAGGLLAAVSSLARLRESVEIAQPTTLIRPRAEDSLGVACPMPARPVFSTVSRPVGHPGDLERCAAGEGVHDALER